MKTNYCKENFDLNSYFEANIEQDEDKETLFCSKLQEVHNLNLALARESQISIV